jgi:multiple sugar transport system ATP-binding protein
MAEVTFDKVEKRFGDVRVIEGFNLNIEDHEFMVLVGPSGCGKSTLLRMLAGLEEISGGRILIDDKVVNDLPPKNRDTAMVFQSYALYPHMSIRENIEFGLKIRKTPKEEIDRRVNEAAQMLDITHLLDRKPRQLSGGQRQRVAVGRAIVRKPSVFLFDEPLSNLDAKLRVQMRAEITKLQQRLETTTVYVTHDQVEAMTMGHRIAVMKDGILQQVGAPLEVYRRPANLFVATFIGTPPMNLFPGALEDGGGTLVASALRIPVPQRYRKLLAGRSDKVTIGIRPENIHAPSQDDVDATAALEMQVDLVEPLGNEVVVYGRSGSDTITAKLSPHRVPTLGETVKLVIELDSVQLFDTASGRRLDAAA